MSLLPPIDSFLFFHICHSAHRISARSPRMDSLPLRLATSLASPENEMEEDNKEEDNKEENSKEEDNKEEDNKEEDNKEEDKMGEDIMGEDIMGEDKMEEDKMEEDKLEEGNKKEDKTEDPNLISNASPPAVSQQTTSAPPTFPLPYPPQHCPAHSSPQPPSIQRRFFPYEIPHSTTKLHRPFYICLTCPIAKTDLSKNTGFPRGFITWDDTIGIRSSNPKCFCGFPSRQDRKCGIHAKGGGFGTGFWTCATGVCGYYSDDYKGVPYGGRKESDDFMPWLLDGIPGLLCGRELIFGREYVLMWFKQLDSLPVCDGLVGTGGYA
ncbi:hypothetical protein GQ43DRAFT_479682 [Delitschia confertaspora ATCC 74209]|uniref:Uncharacterized protein n=1 Tax=Delitschia confertaspora ATCC 74209 TaxID=1513339 RepID=A0A9P4JT04_9PLEO|nr:hypothetical protein GQ43DRAFT_479682 [Delitschia confertaspora ATCC 74209]